jgi:hypothetical protein
MASLNVYASTHDVFTLKCEHAIKHHQTVACHFFFVKIGLLLNSTTRLCQSQSRQACHWGVLLTVYLSSYVFLP